MHTPPDKKEFIATLIQMLATMEYFYLTESEAKALHSVWPTLTQRNNNPLGLPKWGSFPSNQGMARFNRAQEGFDAAKHFVNKNVFTRRTTFTEFFAGCTRGADIYKGYRSIELGYNSETYVAALIGYLSLKTEYISRYESARGISVTGDTVIAELI
jgi:hypothetical protein